MLKFISQIIILLMFWPAFWIRFGTLADVWQHGSNVDLQIQIHELIMTSHSFIYFYGQTRQAFNRTDSDRLDHIVHTQYFSLVQFIAVSQPAVTVLSAINFCNFLVSVRTEIPSMQQIEFLIPYIVMFFYLLKLSPSSLV